MKKLWLRIREAAVRKMVRLEYPPDVVLEKSTDLLVNRYGKVESPVHYDAVRYAVEKKFSGVSDADLRKVSGEDEVYAKLERLRRAE